jgi:hypothetical protein
MRSFRWPPGGSSYGVPDHVDKVAAARGAHTIDHRLQTSGGAWVDVADIGLARAAMVSWTRRRSCGSDALHTSPVQVSRSTIALLTSGRVPRTRPVRGTGAGALRTRSAVSCNSVSACSPWQRPPPCERPSVTSLDAHVDPGTTAVVQAGESYVERCSTLTTSPSPSCPGEDRRRGPNGTGKSTALRRQRHGEPRGLSVKSTLQCG